MKLGDPRLPTGTDIGRLIPALYDVLRRIVAAINGADDALVMRGTGSPEGVTAASVGRLYVRTDGGVGSTLYVKESGTGAAGWAAK